jgi:sugar lactone lactonase YvrE
MRKLVLVPLAVACILVAASASAAEVETIALFNHPAETPENLKIDRHGNIYVSLSSTGEIRQIAPNGTQSTLTVVPLQAIPPCSPGITGLALDYQESVYVAVRSCDDAETGIWKVGQNGELHQIAHLPGGRPNGMAFHTGAIYVADSGLGRVWRVEADGQSLPDIWSVDPLLQHPQNPPPGIPGPNGLQIFRNEVYVSVSTRGHIVALPIEDDGSAGPGRVRAVIGCDDFAIDVRGNIYAMDNFGSRVVRIRPNGTQEILLTIADGLDGPSAGAFGVGKDKRSLYITNAAFFFFPGPTPRRPSVMRVPIGIPGAPRP